VSRGARAGGVLGGAWGAAAWRFFAMASVSVPQVPGTPDLGATSPAAKEAVA